MSKSNYLYKPVGRPPIVANRNHEDTSRTEMNLDHTPLDVSPIPVFRRLAVEEMPDHPASKYSYIHHK